MIICYSNNEKKRQWRSSTKCVNGLEQHHTGLGRHTERRCFAAVMVINLFLIIPSSSFSSFPLLPHPSFPFFSSSSSFSPLPSYLIKNNRKRGKYLALRKDRLCVKHHLWWFHMQSLIQYSKQTFEWIFLSLFYKWRNEDVPKSSELLLDAQRVSDSSEADYPCLSHH